MFIPLRRAIESAVANRRTRDELQATLEAILSRSKLPNKGAVEKYVKRLLDDIAPAKYPSRINPLTGQAEELRPSNAGTGPNRWERIDRTPQPGELHRPHVRKPVLDEIYKNAPRDAQGRLLDPNTGKPIQGTPDVGHKPGHEFWREKAKAEAEGLTQQQFNERMNNADLYQLEDPMTNRGHGFEMPK